jgi:glutamine synthetase type III
MHQNVIKELFGKVLIQGQVLGNLFPGGGFTFAGLVRH